MVTDGNGEVRRYRFKMEGKRKGERLIITKKRGLVFRRKAKVEIEDKSFSK